MLLFFAHIDNCIASEEKERLRYEGRTVDALVPTAEEGRGQLRKASVRRKRPETRRCPNGGTRPGAARTPVLSGRHPGK